MFDFDTVKKIQQDVEARLNEIDQALQSANARRSAVLYAPAARADVVAMLGSWVDSKAGEFTHAMRNRVLPFVQTPSSLNSKTAISHHVTLGADEASFDAMLCALFAQQIKKGLADVVGAMDWHADGEGLPLAQRDGAIAEIDREIERLQLERADLINRSTDAGLQF